MLKTMVRYWKEHPDRRVKFTLVTPLFPLILVCKVIGIIGYRVDQWVARFVEGESSYEIME